MESCKKGWKENLQLKYSVNKSYATSTAVNPNPEVATAECQAALPVWLPVNPIDGLLSLLG